MVLKARMAWITGLCQLESPCNRMVCPLQVFSSQIHAFSPCSLRMCPVNPISVASTRICMVACSPYDEWYALCQGLVAENTSLATQGQCQRAIYGLRLAPTHRPGAQLLPHYVVLCTVPLLLALRSPPGIQPLVCVLAVAAWMAVTGQICQMSKMYVSKMVTNAQLCTKHARIITVASQVSQLLHIILTVLP